MDQKDTRPARPMTKEDSWGELRLTLTHRQTKTAVTAANNNTPDFRAKA